MKHQPHTAKMESSGMESSGIAIARQMEHDSVADTDPQSNFWSGAPSVIADKDRQGNAVAGHRTEIFLQWTGNDLYLLFVCPYEELHLKAHPCLTEETNELWNWDVAEVFIGDDFKNIRRYKEFEVSPQGEWVDLDVNLDKPPHEVGWVWQSGCEVAARIDAEQKVWYGFMRIPWLAIDSRPAVVGNELRVNFYRCQGAEPERKYINWQPVNCDSFHTPESFGILRLAAHSTGVAL
jgi:hypothetical protein